MKKRIPRRILTVILSLVMILTLLPAAALAADETGGTTTSSGIELSKTATLEDDGTYTINLEAYATGTTTTTTVTSSAPLDIVLVIDQSGSMTDSITSVSGYTARTSQAYTYQGYGNNTYYYLAEDGNYYAVSRGSQRQNQGGGSGGGNNNYYYLYYTDANGNTVYLSGTGTTTTQPTNVTNQNTTIWTGVLYTATSTTTTKLAALKSAVTSFVETIQEDAEKNNVNHRIAIAGFASNSSDGSSGYGSYSISTGSSSTSWVNTGLFLGTSGNLTNYGSLTDSNYASALVSVNDNGKVAASITAAIDNFAASGATRTQYGLTMANNIFKNNSNTYTDADGNTQTRKRIVIVFTDGQPGQSSYDGTEANSAISAAYTTKTTYSATVYSVGLYTTTQSDNVTNFMNYISSNYPSAQSTSSTGTKATDAKYYMTASDATELSKIFSTISTDVSQDSTTVTLNAESVMKDIMAEGFTLTSDSTVSIKTVAGSVVDGEIVWGDDTETSKDASYSISDDKTTVSVTGFDYADKYISSGHAGEKICVTITGVLPTTDVTTDEKVFTNSSASGIYADATAETAAAYFPVPDTIITKKLYVLDYGKQVTLDGLDQSSVTGIVDTYQAVDNVNGTDNALTVKDSSLTYGNATLSSDILTYTPTTTNWDGYDSLYVFGQTSDETIKSYSANSNGNLWSKLSVIPASNVYYEDDFVDSESDGVVGISYSGTWTTASGETSSASASQSSENILYGTDAAYADDTTYTDGSAQKGQSGATATFTFTGTGVDIYSSTDNDACIVYVYLYDADENLKQYVVANNYADDGKYYVVPTVTFEDLDYGTYKVKLRVVKSSTDSAAVNYYLDGIRVYNPLGTVTDDGSDAGDAYAAANELNAVYTEIRAMLLDEDTIADFSGGDGALFIDEIASDTKNETTTVLSTYESVGPEHETYLKVGNGVAFTLSGFNAETDAVYVGIKLTGMSTGAVYNSGTVEVTDGSGKTTLKITSTADQYYKITPDENGNVVIKNTSEGGAVISLTKLRTTSTEPKGDDVVITSNEATVEYALTTFSTLSLTGSSSEILTEDGSDDDAAVDTETEDDTTGDVVIETETPEQDSSGGSSSQDTFSSIFNKIIGWMSGRR